MSFSITRRHDVQGPERVALDRGGRSVWPDHAAGDPRHGADALWQAAQDVWRPGGAALARRRITHGRWTW